MKVSLPDYLVFNLAAVLDEQQLSNEKEVIKFIVEAVDYYIENKFVVTKGVKDGTQIS